MLLSAAIASKKIAALMACVSMLTGHPLPSAEIVWVEMPPEIIVDEAMKRGLPNALYTDAIYFGQGPGNTGIVWHAQPLSQAIAAHEIAHHLQEQAASPLDFWQRERQAKCVEAMSACIQPIEGYCHAAP